MTNFVNIPVNEIDGKYYVSNVDAIKAIDEASVEQHWSDTDYDNALIKLRELNNRKFGFTYGTVVLVQCSCGHWEFFQIPGHGEITEDFIEDCFGDDICSICHMAPIQRAFIKESKKHVKESFDSKLKTVSKILDYYQNDGKSENLKDTADYILELIKIKVDPETVLSNVDDYILDLTEEGFNEEADELQKAIAGDFSSQKESMKAYKRIFESLEDTDCVNALEELKAVLDYYQGDESLNDKPGYLTEQSLRILDAIESYVNVPFDSVTKVDLESILEDANSYAESLYKEGLEDEADEVWDALAFWRQN